MESLTVQLINHTSQAVYVQLTNNTGNSGSHAIEANILRRTYAGSECLDCNAFHLPWADFDTALYYGAVKELNRDLSAWLIEPLRARTGFIYEALDEGFDSPLWQQLEEEVRSD